MTELHRRLGRNFTLGELLASETAERNPDMLKEQHNPPPEVVANLAYLVGVTLQPIRETLNFPIRVSSGYRSPSLNKAVNGSSTSQHCIGQAVDIQLSQRFLTDPATEAIRRRIEARILAHTDKPIRRDASANFYLFAYCCLRMEDFDVDQVIHEYGHGFGQPAWVHVSAGAHKNKRQILCYGRYWTRETHGVDFSEALAFGI